MSLSGRVSRAHLESGIRALQRLQSEEGAVGPAHFNLKELREAPLFHDVRDLEVHGKELRLPQKGQSANAQPHQLRGARETADGPPRQSDRLVKLLGLFLAESSVDGGRSRRLAVPHLLATEPVKVVHGMLEALHRLKRLLESQDLLVPWAAQQLVASLGALEVPIEDVVATGEGTQEHAKARVSRALRHLAVGAHGLQELAQGVCFQPQIVAELLQIPLPKGQIGST